MYYSGYPSQVNLVAWGLLAAGQPFQSAPMQRHLSWVLSYDTHHNYDLATRLQCLNILPDLGWERWVRRDAVLLSELLLDDGSFKQTFQHTAGGTNAENQYGVMGLWVADRRGVRLKPEIRLKIDKYWRGGQLIEPAGGAGGALYPKSIVDNAADNHALPIPISGF